MGRTTHRRTPAVNENDNAERTKGNRNRVRKRKPLTISEQHATHFCFPLFIFLFGRPFLAGCAGYWLRSKRNCVFSVIFLSLSLDDSMLLIFGLTFAAHIHCLCATFIAGDLFDCAFVRSAGFG